jgi:hypothetical protein
MTLRIGLEPLFIGRVRPSKRTFVIDCPEYGRLCAIPRMRNAVSRDVSEAQDNSRRESLLTRHAGAPDDSQHRMPERLIVFVGYKSDSSPERYRDRGCREGTRAAERWSLR